MAVSNYAELLAHAGHNVGVTTYGDHKAPDNVGIECMTCNEVLLDYDHPEDAEEQPTMTNYNFVVTVTTDTLEHAVIVMEERIGYDERLYEYGPEEEPETRGPEIKYSVSWAAGEASEEEDDA